MNTTQQKFSPNYGESNKQSHAISNMDRRYFLKCATALGVVGVLGRYTYGQDQKSGASVTQADIIRYGICQWSMPGLAPAEAAPVLHAVGLDGIELDAGNWDGQHLKLTDRSLQDEWKQACAEHRIELPVLGVNALCSDGMSKSQKQEKVCAILADAVEIAHAMSIPLLQLPSFGNGAISSDEDLATTAQRLQYVCDLAHSHCIQVGTENALTVEQHDKLMDQVNRRNLKVFFDTQNPWAMKQLKSRMLLEAEYGDLCRVAHLKDGKDKTLSNALLGEGTSDFNNTMAVFRERKFTGWFIMENSYGKSIPGDWQASVQKDIAKAKEIMR
jgi:2-epi-5-epi-valiolone 7-phosphate 2-epimerase